MTMWSKRCVVRCANHDIISFNRLIQVVWQESRFLPRIMSVSQRNDPSRKVASHPMRNTRPRIIAAPTLKLAVVLQDKRARLIWTEHSARFTLSSVAKCVPFAEIPRNFGRASRKSFRFEAREEKRIASSSEVSPRRSLPYKFLPH